MRFVLLLAALVPAISCEIGSFEHHTAHMADGSLLPDGCTPLTEICDGVDNDCDGLVDNDDPSLVANDVNNCGECGYVCDLPNVDIHSCTNGECGIAKCDEGYSDLNETDADGCESNCVKDMEWDPCDGRDNDCNGIVDDWFDLTSDPNNCGECDFRCAEQYPEAQYHVLSFGCSGGQCRIAACAEGYYDRDGVLDDGQGNLGCEYACTVQYTVELCNGVDDNCDGLVDNNPVDRPACLTDGVCAGTQAVCDAQTGTWDCPYPSATYQLIEDGSHGCDGLDNDCDGEADEAFGVGDLCSAGQGACRRTGTYVCNSGGTDSVCGAVPGTPGTETCDGLDNDCDGLVDEDFWDDMNGNYVRPAVVPIGGGVYMFAYEASRPNATATSAGTGNGYHCSSNCGAGVPVAPTGVPLESTRACSVQGRLPWFNVSPVEAEQTCRAIGGRVCTTTEWQNACRAGINCTWGYSAQCTTAANYTTRYCNLGAYDFSTAPGDQDGLLVTGSPLLGQCWAALAGGNLYDITGNLHEITKSAANQYPLMGGAFNTTSETGASCTFSFYAVEEDFRLWDTGFRCCFSANPSP